MKKPVKLIESVLLLGVKLEPFFEVSWAWLVLRFARRSVGAGCRDSLNFESLKKDFVAVLQEFFKGGRSQ